MANPEHLAKLKEGVEAWNHWRQLNQQIEPDLSVADLNGADLRGANLRGANLVEAQLYSADLRGANLVDADLSGAELGGADLRDANLRKVLLSDAKLYNADLSGADLSDSDLGRADLSMTDLSGANLSGANLYGASLRRTNLENADLTACQVYGISVWDARLDGAKQSNLLITRVGERGISVDSLEVAQFIYFLLNNDKIRHVIDSITSKVVLILGRFTAERKIVLDAIRDELRKHDYLPVLFDFEKPASKDLTGTVTTLANMARFVIADLTEPSSVPHELAMVAPSTVVPIQTILLEGHPEYAMFVDLKKRYHWVLAPYEYKSKDLLIAHLNESVIAPAEAKAKELAQK